MPNTLPTEQSFDEFDEINYPRPEISDFEKVVDRAMSRRALLGRGLGLGAAAFVMGTTALTPMTARADGRFGFTPVPANTLDTVTVPDGYSWHIVAKWGDPLWSDAADFDEATTGTGATQERQFGDNNDGMSLFVDGGRTILAVNNEYTNRSIMYHARETKLPENADDVRKGKAAHGVSVVEVARNDGVWGIVKDSHYNRRITADTPMMITGPAAGHDLLKTSADRSGTTSLGTWNNCGNGKTPWGT